MNDAFSLHLQGMEKCKRAKSLRKKPRKQENRVSGALGGRRQPGSGAFDSKGDVSTGGEFPLLVECKRTSGNKTIRVDSAWLAKITREAHAVGSYPALSIEFDQEIVAGLEGSPEATWVALPLSVLRGLLEANGEAHV